MTLDYECYYVMSMSCFAAIFDLENNLYLAQV